MKAKKITSLVLALALILTFAPMNVKAANDMIILSTIETREICHCGGTRMVSRVITREENIIPCPEHGAACADCYRIYRADFHYCSNPHCTDVWYDRETSTIVHIYGR